MTEDRLAAARAARWPDGRQRLSPKLCAHCGNEFSPKPWHKPGDWAQAMFCSRACSSKSRAIPLADRLTSHSVRNLETGCLEWTGYRNPKGYGRLGTNDENPEVEAHRAAWMFSYGPIPAGMHVLHRCDNPPCIEPTHLFLGTNRDNVDDKVAKRRQRGAIGEANTKAKLSPAQVAAIRSDTRYQKAIAADYGINQSSVSAIKRHSTWRHI